jgi:hypothetical protein
MLPFNKFQIKNIKGGEATFDKRFFTLLVDVSLSDFLSKNLNINLLSSNIYYHNIYKRIAIFQNLHKVRVSFLQDFLSKSLMLNLSRWNIYFRTIYNKS